MNKKDSLGDRMKSYYEQITKTFLPRRTYTIIRVDGKAFHTYTKGLKKPFDEQLVDDMDVTAMYMCEHIQGAKFAFVQSDEISILLTDFDALQTDAWFNGNIQKMVSVSASLATAKFNDLRPNKIALFDSRVFTIPSYIEVENYFIWRQQDTTRNSISSVAQWLYSPFDLHLKTTNMMQDMCMEKSINWNDYDEKLKRGRLIIKEQCDNKKTKWVSVAPPIFTQDREIFNTLIPEN